MRLIIDTNILVSAFIFGGAMKHKLDDVLADERISLLVSPIMLEELKEVVFREQFLRFQEKQELEALLADVLEDVVIVPITKKFTDCRDPKDNKFLDAAVSGHADFIITGDADLLVLHPFHSVNIVTITDFIEHYICEG